MNMQEIAGGTRGGIGGTAARAPVQLPKSSFAAELARRTEAAKDPANDAERLAHEGAKGLVAHALILPMLKQVRRSALHTKGVFSPGTGEKTFGPEFDMQIADRIAQSPKLTLTASLTKRLVARSGAAKSGGVDVRG